MTNVSGTAAEMLIFGGLRQKAPNPPYDKNPKPTLSIAPAAMPTFDRLLQFMITSRPNAARLKSNNLGIEK
ncbi:MAG: hypothetical protein A3E84_01705 [Gammaproteobacteria bacterium RIFCSPHIGHO2_12_FULL_42_13]|nr:MAG: hypothetical protein A3E84_01705 [Gammaproteobacteria bacterium RIFCSPHIGHO2_12_FULL_42_13]